MKGGNMKYKYITSIVIILIVLIAGYMWMQSQPVVSATGQATLKVQPDTVKIYIGIDSRNSSASAAQDSNQAVYSLLEARLIALGLDKKSIQTSSYNVYPEYDWASGVQKQKGYVASRQIVIESKDFTVVGKIVDAAVEAGASTSGINFELSLAKQNEYKVQVLKEAGQDAKVKAGAIAAGVGKNLGGLAGVASQDFNYYPYPLYAKAGASMAEDNAAAQRVALNIQPTDLDVTATITAQYRLSPF